MGYNIRYHEMNEYCELTQEWASAVKEVLGELKIRFQELADEDMLEGATAKAVCSYVDGFHIRVIEGITVLLEHLMSCLKVYQDDYYTNIDAFKETRLSEDAFTECIDRLQRQKGQLEDIQCEVERILRTVDFAYFQKPVEESAKYANEALVQKVRELAESVAAMEETHRNDMAGDAELFGALNRFINGSRWQSVNSNIESHVEGITGGTEGQTLDVLTGRVQNEVSRIEYEKVQEHFVGYLAYGTGEITLDSEVGFYRLYDRPTLQSEGDQYFFDDLYEEYGFTAYGALQSYCDANSGLNKQNENITYGGQELDAYVGTLTYNGIERYAIALGPKLQNPEWELADGLNADDMAYGTCVDISIQIEGRTYYIPAIIVDVKAHSAPDGIYQTNVSCEDLSVDNSGGDARAIVEWYVIKEDGGNKSSGLLQFDHGSSVIIYRDEVLE